MAQESGRQNAELGISENMVRLIRSIFRSEQSCPRFIWAPQRPEAPLATRPQAFQISLFPECVNQGRGALEFHQQVEL
jgi:hypothetical protein